LPLPVLGKRKTGENSGNEIERSNNAKNPQNLDKKFDLIRQRELKITDNKSPNTTKE